jgi:transposase
LSNANLTAIEAAGDVPDVPLKSNSKGEGTAAWRKMWGCFMYCQDECQAHYHLRSNVESVFSAIKRKFGGSVRSKRYTAQANEILCKILCYNLSILAQDVRELGIVPSFSGDVAA